MKRALIMLSAALLAVVLIMPASAHEGDHDDVPDEPTFLLLSFQTSTTASMQKQEFVGFAEVDEDSPEHDMFHALYDAIFTYHEAFALFPYYEVPSLSLMGKGCHGNIPIKWWRTCEDWHNYPVPPDPFCAKWGPWEPWEYHYSHCGSSGHH